MNDLGYHLVIEAGVSISITRDVKNAVIAFLQERLDAIPDITWDQFQQRSSIIKIIEELRE
jgi:hypothetical protein